MNKQFLLTTTLLFSSFYSHAMLIQRSTALKSMIPTNFSIQKNRKIIKTDYRKKYCNKNEEPFDKMALFKIVVEKSNENEAKAKTPILKKGCEIFKDTSSLERTALTSPLLGVLNYSFDINSLGFLSSLAISYILFDKYHKKITKALISYAPYEAENKTLNDINILETLILTKKYNLEEKNTNRKTVLEVAYDLNDYESVLTLLENGAKIVDPTTIMPINMNGKLEKTLWTSLGTTILIYVPHFLICAVLLPYDTDFTYLGLAFLNKTLLTPPITYAFFYIQEKYSKKNTLYRKINHLIEKQRENRKLISEKNKKINLTKPLD